MVDKKRVWSRECFFLPWSFGEAERDEIWCRVDRFAFTGWGRNLFVEKYQGIDSWGSGDFDDRLCWYTNCGIGDEIRGFRLCGEARHSGRDFEKDPGHFGTDCCSRTKKADKKAPIGAIHQRYESGSRQTLRIYSIGSSDYDDCIDYRRKWFR